MLSFQIGRDLAEVTMGLHRYEMGRTGGGKVLEGEGLMPLFNGNKLVTARVYAGWEPILAGLEAASATLAAGPRRVFLDGMVKSLKVAVNIFIGGTPSFVEKIATLVGAPAGREDPALIEDARARLDRLLTRSGFSTGALCDRIHAWEHSRAVSQDKIEAVFRELMAEAKARTDRLVFDTGDYDMALNPVRNKMFTARCLFHAGKMDLNLDIEFTRAALKHLICHEVYPGHSTQLLYTTAEAEPDRAPLDALLIATNAITGCVQEGIGDQGIHLIDWIEDADDEIHAEWRRIKSAAQTSAAWMLMVDGLPAETVADNRRDTAMGQEAWIKGRLRMASDPVRGPFISSYWAGKESVRRVRERVTKAQWPDFLFARLGRAQSPASLEMFPAMPN